MQKIKEYGEKINKITDKYSVVFFIFAAIVVAANYGAERIFDVNFVCTNGDYQNYNVLRRVVEGQVPYRDFASYLGMGLILMCKPFLSVHNSFAASLFITNAVILFAFIVFVTVVFYLITGNKNVSFMVGIILPKLLSSGIIESFIPVYGYYTKTYLELLAYPNNSFRMGRMLWAVLLCRFALFYSEKYKKSDISALRYAAGTAKGVAVMGFITGLGVTWSNDFGFCCIGSVTVIVIILALADVYQKTPVPLLWKRFLYFIPSLLVGSLLSMIIATKGDIMSWIKFTTGVSQWQYTFYDQNIVEKIITLPLLLTSEATARSRIHFVIYIVSMVCCLALLCKKKENDRVIVFVFLFTSIVAAQLLYIIGSGPDGFVEGTYSFVIIGFWAVIAHFVLKAIKIIKIQGTVENLSKILTLVFTVFMTVQLFSTVNNYKLQNFKAADNYVYQLEGVTDYAAPLKEMYSIVGQDEMFATFATALDDMRGTFQPTGCDYVIHALGDELQNSYIENFNTNNYKWVQTTNTDVWPWEIWVSHTAWNFYRELYSDYSFHSNHNVWTLWQYAGENSNVIEPENNCEIEIMDDGSIKITVTSDEKRPCFVDVSIDWETEEIKNIQNIMTFRHIVFVEADYLNRANSFIKGFFLKDRGKRYIPIYIENGVGHVILKAVPAETTKIKLNSITINKTIIVQK
ncbi:MAG: hypothetical protein IJ362_01315 [Oscillospiraceae bacterium]|nr:hypothetical protein [Oscillospiraceae bacterium]